MNDYLDLPTINEAACQGCGACCMNQFRPPFWSYDDDDYDFQRLPASLKREVLAAAARPISSPCIWLDMTTRRCQHYEYRPFCCREFQPGSEVCHDDRLLRGIDPPPL